MLESRCPRKKPVDRGVLITSFLIYHGSLKSLTIKLTIKPRIWKIIPKTVVNTRHHSSKI